MGLKYLGPVPNEQTALAFAHENEILLVGPVIEAEFSYMIAYGRLGNKSHIAQNGCVVSKVTSFRFARRRYCLHFGVKHLLSN